jgi:hypothetical protein
MTSLAAAASGITRLKVVPFSSPLWFFHVMLPLPPANGPLCFANRRDVTVDQPLQSYLVLRTMQRDEDLRLRLHVSQLGGGVVLHHVFLAPCL